MKAHVEENWTDPDTRERRRTEWRDARREEMDEARKAGGGGRGGERGLEPETDKDLGRPRTNHRFC